MCLSVRRMNAFFINFTFSSNKWLCCLCAHFKLHMDILTAHKWVCKTTTTTRVSETRRRKRSKNYAMLCIIVHWFFSSLVPNQFKLKEKPVNNDLRICLLSLSFCLTSMVRWFHKNVWGKLSYLAILSVFFYYFYFMVDLGARVTEEN